MECFLMDSLFIWGLSPVLTVEQAAFLSVGLEPSDNEKPKKVEAVISLLANAINTGGLNAEIICKAERAKWDLNKEDGEYFYRPHPDHYYGVDVKYSKHPDWKQTTVKTADLKKWLSSINLKHPPLFSVASNIPDYLNKEHPRYSEQLAAAVNVWIAFEDGSLLGAKSPKMAMNDWLTSRYSELGLVHEGKISKEAIKECAKVANWKDKGGATATPTNNLPTT